MTLTKKQLLAIDNMAILTRAKEAGLILYREDLFVNYSEIDLTLSSMEDMWEQGAAAILVKRFMAWLKTVKDKKDLIPEKMDLGLQPLILDFIRSVWEYGQQTADAEVQGLETVAFGDGGEPKLTDLTNTDAFEWYELYTRELAKQGVSAAFTYMQSLILEKLDAGKVRLELEADLEEAFRRFGYVRTRIISRTESNKAFNWGRRYRFDKSAAIAGYRYSAILDDRTTEICQALHGHSWAIDDPELDPNTPPNHYQCRSILVPISKYRAWTFDPPPGGWQADLPASERKVYEKFRDSTFYPKAGTVARKETPVLESPKLKAKPKKAPAAPKPSRSRLKLSPADQEAIKRFDELTKGIDYSKGRKKVARELLDRAGLNHVKVSVRKITSFGRVEYYDRDTMHATDFILDSKDLRGEDEQFRTLFHEFYHVNYHGLKHDYKKKTFTKGGDLLTRAEWLRWEETATETAAHFMFHRAIGGRKTIPSYSDYLMKTLPLLKQLDDFSDCVYVEDFGEKFMKYRFSSNPSVKWKELHDQLAPLEKDFDWASYWKSYEEIVWEHEDAIVEEILATYSLTAEERKEDWYINQVRNGIKKGWTTMGNKDGGIFAKSVLAAMMREGVR